MLSKPRRAWLALALFLASLSASTAQAGVFSDMIARRRAQRQMQSQARSNPEASPFHGRAVGGSLVPPSLAQRFQTRFPTHRDAKSTTPPGTLSRGMISMDRASDPFSTNR